MMKTNQNVRKYYILFSFICNFNIKKISFDEKRFRNDIFEKNG